MNKVFALGDTRPPNRQRPWQARLAPPGRSAVPHLPAGLHRYNALEIRAAITSRPDSMTNLPTYLRQLVPTADVSNAQNIAQSEHDRRRTLFTQPASPAPAAGYQRIEADIRRTGRGRVEAMFLVTCMPRTWNHGTAAARRLPRPQLELTAPTEPSASPSPGHRGTAPLPSAARCPNIRGVILPNHHHIRRHIDLRSTTEANIGSGSLAVTILLSCWSSHTRKSTSGGPLIPEGFYE